METQESCKWRGKFCGERLTRRVLLAAAFGGRMPAQSSEVSPIDLSLIDDLAVPNELFYVREHFPRPEGLSAATWKLAVPGREYSLEEVMNMPGKVLPATLECAENAIGGGLVSHAEWRGWAPASPRPAGGLRPRFVC